MAQNIKGRTMGRRVPLRAEGTYATPSWQQHQQLDPLTAARNVRKKKRK
jgi:hypothetical protein